MARVNNVMRCESCPKWVRSLKGTMFCDDCLKLNAVLNESWQKPQMPELSAIEELIASFPTAITDNKT
jgi:hypothetical protein